VSRLFTRTFPAARITHIITKYCDDHVCLFLSLFNCLYARLTRKQATRPNFTKVLCLLAVAAVARASSDTYVKYFRFCGLRNVLIPWIIGQNTAWRYISKSSPGGATSLWSDNWYFVEFIGIRRQSLHYNLFLLRRSAEVWNSACSSAEQRDSESSESVVRVRCVWFVMSPPVRLPLSLHGKTRAPGTATRRTYSELTPCRTLAYGPMVWKRDVIHKTGSINRQAKDWKKARRSAQSCTACFLQSREDLSLQTQFSLTILLCPRSGTCHYGHINRSYLLT